jgi:hypothetical protein
MEPVATPISGVPCDWAMTDRDGYGYPHGAPATTRVTNACEFFNGNFCDRHARLAVKRSIAQAAANEREF